MDLNELKSTWRNTGGTGKSQAELQWMTKVRNHPKLRSVKTKLIIEVILLLVFLSVYHEALDGGNRPLWLNTMLIVSVLLFVANDIAGYLTLRNVVQGDDIARSLKELERKLKRLIISSLIASCAFGVSLILFLTFNVPFTVGKYALLGGMVVTLGIMTYISHRIWSERANQIRQSALEFRENE